MTAQASAIYLIGGVFPAWGAMSQPDPPIEAHISLPRVAVATANREGLQLDFDVDVDQDGKTEVVVWARSTCSRSRKMLMLLDEYEWERLKKAMAVIDELKRKIDEGGAFFKIGSAPKNCG